MLRLLKQMPLPVALFLLLLLMLLPLSPVLWDLWQKHNPFYGKWEDDLTYYNASAYDKTLEEAIARWQETGIPLRFREVDGPHQADLVIYSSEDELRKRCSNCSGYASIGDNIFQQARIDLLPPNNRFEEEIVDFSRVGTLIHELGHTLGLNHRDEGCSIMHSESVCNIDRVYDMNGSPRIFCGPWEDDLTALGDLYDFKPRVVSPSCQHKTEREQLLFKRSKSMFTPLSRGVAYLDRAILSKDFASKANKLQKSLVYLKISLMRSRTKVERKYLQQAIASIGVLTGDFSSVARGEGR